MWTYTLAPMLILLAILGVMLAVPVCLGMLLRLFIRKTRPILVGWFGAALILASQHSAGDHGTMMKDILDRWPPGCESFTVTLGMGALGVLVPLCWAFVFVKWGVDLVDRQREKPSGRFWLVACPIIAATVNAGVLYALMYLSLITGVTGRFAHLFFVLYRFMWWEMLCVPCVAFFITLVCVNQRRKQSPNPTAVDSLTPRRGSASTL